MFSTKIQWAKLKVQSGGSFSLTAGNQNGGGFSSSADESSLLLPDERGNRPSSCRTVQAAMSSMCVEAHPSWLPKSNFELGFLNAFSQK